MRVLRRAEIAGLPRPLATRITGRSLHQIASIASPAPERADPMADNDVLIVIPARMASTRPCRASRSPDIGGPCR